MMYKYKVYEIDPTYGYHGKALVAANSAIEANKIIDEFQQEDSDNVSDSRGYSHVDEFNCISSIRSEEKGILLYEIYYDGGL